MAKTQETAWQFEMKKRSLVGRWFEAWRRSAVCIANGLSGAKHCARKYKLRQFHLWLSFSKQTIRDLASIFFHEIVPDPYEMREPAKNFAVLFIPGYSMTANGASPLLANISRAGCQIVKCKERMWFKNVRKISRWANKQTTIIRASGLKPILLGYSMGGDIAQRVGYKMGVDAISLSTPIMSQHTFFAALDLILRGRVSSRKTFRNGYGTSLSEAFSFHIPRPDREGHIITKGVYSHFCVNNPDIVKTVVGRIEKIMEESLAAIDAPRVSFVFRSIPAERDEWAASISSPSFTALGVNDSKPKSTAVKVDSCRARLSESIDATIEQKEDLA